MHASDRVCEMDRNRLTIMGCARIVVQARALQKRATFKIPKTNINEIFLFVNKFVYLRTKAVFTIIVTFIAVANIISPTYNNALVPNMLTCGLSPYDKRRSSSRTLHR